MAKAKKDDRVDKRRVTMANSIAVEEGDKIVTRMVTATDYVRPDFLDAYVADAKRRWAVVKVSDEPDAGPAGYDGATFVPFGVQHRDPATGAEEWHAFPHELAGTYFPASDCTRCTHAPQHPVTGEKARLVRGEEG